MESNLVVKWVDSGREPQAAPNPKYPHGIDLDVSAGEPTCSTELPYPAKRCGFYLVSCQKCGLSCMATTAGRPDDPRSLKVSCKVIQ